MIWGSCAAIPFLSFDVDTDLSSEELSLMSYVFSHAVGNVGLEARSFLLSTSVGCSRAMTGSAEPKYAHGLLLFRCERRSGKGEREAHYSMKRIVVTTQ
jgi:hypothetical protein